MLTGGLRRASTSGYLLATRRVDGRVRLLTSRVMPCTARGKHNQGEAAASPYRFLGKHRKIAYFALGKKTHLTFVNGVLSYYHL